jgi:hypothetical protein
MITSKNGSAWTKSDRKTLKTRVKEGKTIKDIATELGRTPAAVIYQKSQMGLTKVTKGTKVRNKEGKVIAEVETQQVETVSTRDRAKEMARAARQIARANGKRITMAMFFVEDL